MRLASPVHETGMYPSRILTHIFSHILSAVMSLRYSDSHGEVGKTLLVNTSRSCVNHDRWKAKLFLALLTFFSAIGELTCSCGIVTTSFCPPPGGFLFGYDTGVVSGAMLLVDKEFSLTPFWHELIVGITIGAAALAAAVAGVLSDMLGRKPVLMLASVVFTAGAVLMGAAINAYMLLAGRATVGLGIGLAAMAVPMYIAESAPAEMRGKLVVLNNLFITSGQFIATIVDGAFSTVPQGWK